MGHPGAGCGNTPRDPHIKQPSKCAKYPLMRETAELDRLLTQVNCRIARLRNAGVVSERKAEQELRKAVEFRAQLMRKIDAQNFAFDA
jgi:hypothetical protein